MIEQDLDVDPEPDPYLLLADPDPGGPMHIWIRRIRIRNTAIIYICIISIPENQMHGFLDSFERRDFIQIIQINLNTCQNRKKVFLLGNVGIIHIVNNWLHPWSIGISTI
jgi:hypothetical protein